MVREADVGGRLRAVEQRLLAEAALRLRIAALERRIAVLLEETAQSTTDVPALLRALDARRALYTQLDADREPA